MRKIKVVTAMGLVVLVLSACGQTGNPEESPTSAADGSVNSMQQDGEKPVQNQQDETEMTKKPQDAPVMTQAPEDGQKPTQTPQDKPEMTQAPQVSTGGLSDTGNSQYEAFLKNEISVTNPYVEGMDLTVMDDKKYESEFEDARKKYAYVDVNDDETPELIFKITSYPSELMYILGICNNELVCFDVFETHTKNIAFGVYDYGLVWEVQNLDDFGMTVYSYTADGQRMQARHFTQENGADLAAYEGEEPEWMDWQYDGDTVNNDELEDLTGEYDYFPDDGTGKLTIKKTDDGYDISDYESESSYRFLADSSNIETIENNRIYIKYPEQVLSDDTAIFGYYILEYNTDKINVYYTKSEKEEGKFLYQAVRKSKDGLSVD